MSLGEPLQAIEFRKAKPEQSVDLEILEGRTRVLHATAGPGTTGLRVRNDGTWKIERIE